ncbi:MAG TPA: DinB family protein [bacterium]|nr:DinB family protein [bacterium]
MICKQPWFERQFPAGLRADLLPVILERLRGTPARLEDRLRPLPAAVRTRRWGQTWSIQENAGHLLDLEPLWRARAEDLLAARPEMSPADLTNRRTHEANHNAMPLETILRGFRGARLELVHRLAAVDEAALAHTAPHPRLRVPMNLVDHLFFVAEHDDYHLARITELLVEAGAI